LIDEDFIIINYNYKFVISYPLAVAVFPAIKKHCSFKINQIHATRDHDACNHAVTDRRERGTYVIPAKIAGNTVAEMQQLSDRNGESSQLRADADIKVVASHRELIGATKRDVLQEGKEGKKRKKSKKKAATSCD